ncbi:uncharacterized mitochondrial protein AtMg00810-like [Juglans regia]|uniref:Uncharacterized mitochondrial protein AtMg00810-like n=1 Tax=Juglans regia TaxID=51240 RepID=A0A6P9F597_JUGRE|nr:uncharacterized mitochondrial protein AtMg00810-like [Juglans regia]
MHEAKPISTPMATSTNLNAFDSEDFNEPTLFRNTVRALQYLSVTRPDIAFTVNKLSQFMHSPKFDHWQAVKRLLQYLKQTISYGLSFIKSANTTLQAFSNVDGQVLVMIDAQQEVFVCFLGRTLSHGVAKSKPQLLVQALKMNIKHSPI